MKISRFQKVLSKRERQGVYAENICDDGKRCKSLSEVQRGDVGV